MKKRLKDKMLDNIMEKCKSAALYGCNSKRVFKSKDNLTLTFAGHIYEPIWEYFAGACRVTLNDGTKDEVLFDVYDKNVDEFKNKTIQVGDMLNVRTVVNSHKFFEV